MHMKNKKKKSLTGGMVKHWNRLLRWVMESLSREILKTQLDMGLARLFQLTFELRAWTR